MTKPRRKVFKFLTACVLAKEEVQLALNELEWKYFLPVYTKPRKLAKELRKVARWLEKR